MAIFARSIFGKILLLSLVLFSFSNRLNSQVTIWLEDFSAGPPAPGWTDNFTDCDGGGSAMVNGNRYEVNDMEGSPCCPLGPTTGGGNNNDWTTNPIDITGYCNVTVSLNYGSIGVFECTPAGPFFACTGNPFTDNGHDQIVMQYRINGGAWIEFFYLCGGGTGVATIGGLSGSTIEVRIMPANKSLGETYWFDNVRIEGSLPPALNPVMPVEICAGLPVNIPLTSTPPGATFTWTNDNTAIGLGASGSGSPIAFTSANVTGTEVGTISVMSSLAGCSGPAGDFTITVNPGPTADNPGNITVCAGQPVDIPLTSASGADLNWTNSNTGTGLGASGNGDISFTAANVSSTQVSNVSITPSLGTCVGPVVNFSVTVSPLPNVNQPNNITVCADAPVTVNFSGTGGAAVNWTNDNPAVGLGSSGLGNINFTAASVTGQEVATISIIPENALGCMGAEKTFTITVNPKAVIDDPGDLSICAGQPIDVFFNGTANNFNWTNNNTGTGIPNSGSGDINVVSPLFFNAPQVSTINVTPTGTCAGPPVGFTVTVNPTSQVSPVNDIEVCPNQPVNVIFSSQPNNVQPLWFNDNTAIGLGVSNTGNIMFTSANVSTPQIAFITVQSIIPTCSGPAIGFSITVNPTPTLTIGTIQCAPNSLTYSVAVTSSAASVTATAGTVTNPSAGNFLISGIPTGTNITITATTGTCTAQQSVTSPNCNCATVPPPTAPNNPVICAGQPVPALMVTAMAGQAVDWYATATGGMALLSNSAAYTPPGPFTPGTYTFFAETRDPATGCLSTTRTAVTLTINATPTMTLPANVTVCTGQPVAVNFTGSTNAVFNWTNNNTNTGLVASGAGNISFTSSTGITMQEVSTVTVTPQLGTCPGTPTNFNITVNPNPTINIVTVDCSVDLLSFSITLMSNAMTVTTTSGTVTNTGGNNFVVSGIPAGTNVTLTAESAAGCMITQVVNAPNCNCAPVPPATNPNNPVICQGLPIPALTVTALPGQAVDWFAASTGGTALAVNTASFTPLGPFAPGVFTFYAETRDPGTGCVSASRTAVTLTINPTPTMMMPANVTVCAGLPVNIMFSGTAGSAFNWTNNNTATGLGASGTGDISFTTSAVAAQQVSVVTVTPQIGTCPGAPVNFNITVNVQPVITIVSVQCAPNLQTYSVNLTCNVATVTASSGIISGGAGTYTVSGIPAGTNIIISATSPSGCNASQGILSPTCNCPNIAPASGPNAPSICESDPIPALTVSVQPGLQVDWYTTPTGGVAVATNMASFTPAGPLTAGVYTFYAETRDPISGCLSATRTAATLTINATPVANSIAPVSVCSGEMVTVNFTGTTGATYSWTNPNTNTGLGASGTGNISITSTAGLTTTEISTLTVTPSIGTCIGMPVNFNITVNAAPSLTIGTVDCAPDLQTYTVVVTANATNLTATAGTVAPSAGGFTISLIPAGTNITLSADLGTTCATTATVMAPNCGCPPVADATMPNNPSVCEGVAIPALTVLAVAGMEVDWYAAATGGTALLTNSTTFTPPGPFTPGMYTFFAEVRDPVTGCLSNARTAVTLTVNPTASINPVGNQTICSGNLVNIIFTGTTGATFNWTNSNTANGAAASGIGDISYTAPAVTNTTTGTITVTPSLGTCMGTPATFDVTIVPLPVITPGLVACAPNLQTYTVDLTVTTGTTITASVGTVTGSTTTGIFQVSQVPAGSNVIITTTSAAACTASVNITSPNCSCPPVGEPTNPNNPSMCQGDPVPALSVTAATGFQVNWFLAPTGGLPVVSNMSSFTPPVPNPPPGTYTFYTESFDPVTGCVSSVRTPVTLTVTAGITASITGTSAICAGDNTMLSVVGGDTWLWSNGATTQTITVNPITTTTYTVRASNNGLCADTVLQTVVVNLPYNVTINALTCDPLEVGTEVLNLTTVAGCDSTVNIITALDPVNCLPVVSITNGSVNCVGDANGTLQVTTTDGFAPYIYDWAGNGLNGTGQITNTGETGLISNLTAGNYSITVTGSNGISTVATGVVTAPAPPALTLTPVVKSNGTNIGCFGYSDGSISALATGGTPPWQYLWSDGQTTPSASNLLEGTYTVTITDNKGCTTTSASTLTGPPEFGLTIDALDVSCGAIEQRLIIAPIGGAAPFLVFADGQQVNGFDVSLTAGSHTIEIEDNEGCVADAVYIVQLPIPVQIVLPADTTIQLGGSLVVNAQTNLTNWASITWNPLLDTLAANTLSQAWSPDKSQSITVTIVDSFGCSDEATMRIIVRNDYQIYAPNIFSPDLDGQNDFWQIFGGPSVELLEDVRIFDRWGDAVYGWSEAKPLSDWQGWDGKSRGKKMDPGVYVYYAWLKLINGERILISGDVTLIR